MHCIIFLEILCYHMLLSHKSLSFNKCKIFPHYDFLQLTLYNTDQTFLSLSSMSCCCTVYVLQSYFELESLLVE